MHLLLSYPCSPSVCCTVRLGLKATYSVLYHNQEKTALLFPIPQSYNKSYMRAAEYQACTRPGTLISNTDQYLSTHGEAIENVWLNKCCQKLAASVNFTLARLDGQAYILFKIIFLKYVVSIAQHFYIKYISFDRCVCACVRAEILYVWLLRAKVNEPLVYLQFMNALNQVLLLIYLQFSRETYNVIPSGCCWTAVVLSSNLCYWYNKNPMVFTFTFRASLTAGPVGLQYV